jgi:predicted nucleic acid-binding protein
VTTFTVLFEACVLYPNVLRNLLMYLALTDLFRARWTAQIQDEWIRSVLRDYPDIPVSRLETSRNLMNEHVREGLIIDYEGLIPALTLPDPNDRHILAAAIQANTDVIVTSNLKDFPVHILKPYGVQAQHPDEFIAELIDLDPIRVCRAVRTHRMSLKNPPKDAKEFLDILRKQSLVISASLLEEMRDLI